MKVKRNDVAEIVSRDLRKHHLDGLYNPCSRCSGCTVESIGDHDCLCPTCTGGKLLDEASGIRIVSTSEYRNVMNQRAEAERARKRAEEAERRRLKAIEAARKKKEHEELVQAKREAARVKRRERAAARRKRIELIRARILKVLHLVADRLHRWASAVGRAVKTSIICRFLVGVSTGSVLLSGASLVAFHFLKSDWMLHASVGEVKGALYLFQKLFLFEAVYVFVIVSFTVLLIIARLVDGSWKNGDDLGPMATSKEDQDDRYLDQL